MTACKCGCGREVAPDRVFVDRDHQAAWLRSEAAARSRSEVPAPQPEQPTTTSGNTNDVSLGSLGCFGLIVAAVWLSVSFYAQSHPDPEGKPSLADSHKQSGDPKIAVEAVVATYLPTAVPRLELMQGNNLDIYVARAEYQDIPFPDRPEAIRRIGKAWCASVEHTLLPSVRLRDVRTGAELASFSCTLERASVKE